MPGYAEDNNLNFLHVHTFFHNTNIYTIYPSREKPLPTIELINDDEYSAGKEKGYHR